jgi:hypothetical protein
VISLSPLSPAHLASATLLQRYYAVRGGKAFSRIGDCGDGSDCCSNCTGMICRQCRLRVRGVSTGVQHSIFDQYHEPLLSLSPSFLSARTRASDNGDGRPSMGNPDTFGSMMMSRAGATLGR